MIKIAIVDDEKYSSQLCRELVQSLKVPNLDIIDDFESGKTFLNEIIEKKVQYDIVILDINMPNINGFEVAKSLNELNLDTLIMFYTVHEQYVFKAYEYQPFRYIRKEFAKEELPFALKCAFEKIESRNERSIIIKTGSSELRIMTKNIEYFEKYQHTIEIFLCNKTSFKIRMTLSQLFEMISDNSFIYAHKGAVVNMKYIEKIISDNIFLRSGKIIPISRRNYKNVKENFSKYIGGVL